MEIFYSLLTCLFLTEHQFRYLEINPISWQAEVVALE